MKKYEIILAFLLSAFIFISCDNSVKSKDNQTIYVYAEKGYSWNCSSDTIRISGQIVNEKIPEFEYLKVGESYYDYTSNYFSRIYFSGIHPAKDDLSIEVKTSAGVLGGNISSPTEIQAITLSTETHLKLNEDFTVSWSGSNADFYNFKMFYVLDDGATSWNESINEYLEDSTITISGSHFNNNGYIHGIEIRPINGPIPEANSEGNMVGNGSGFLYYFDRWYFPINGLIIIGDSTEYVLSKNSNITTTNSSFKLIETMIVDQK